MATTVRKSRMKRVSRCWDQPGQASSLRCHSRTVDLQRPKELDVRLDDLRKSDRVECGAALRRHDGLVRGRSLTVRLAEKGRGRGEERAQRSSQKADNSSEAAFLEFEARAGPLLARGFHTPRSGVPATPGRPVLDLHS